MSQRLGGEGELHRYNEFLANGFTFAAAPLVVGEGDGKQVPRNYVDQQRLFYELALALREGQLFFKALSFHGLAVVEVTLTGVRGHGLYWMDTVPPGSVVAVDPSVKAGTVTLPSRLFSDETVLALLNEIRWAMGYQVAWKADQNVKGMMEAVLRERPSSS